MESSEDLGKHKDEEELKNKTENSDAARIE